MYPLAKEGFHGGTELYVRRIASGLAGKGHVCHVVAPDLEGPMQMRGEREFWWGPESFPTEADCVVMFHALAGVEPYSADLLVLATNGVDPYLGSDPAWVHNIDAYPVFSQKHAELLTLNRGVPPERMYVTGLGVDDAEPSSILTVPHRWFYSNDPARGLWHVLDIFQEYRLEFPEATLHVGYSFDRQFEHHRWNATSTAEALWACRERMENDRSITVLPEMTRADVAREMGECFVHVMPSDPPNVGSQIHGMLQMELASYGVPLVLASTEAFPEVFGEAAMILPLPGTFIPEHMVRYSCVDWACELVNLAREPERMLEMSQKSFALAGRHSWRAVVDRWDSMLVLLEGQVGRARTAVGV